MLIDCTPKLYVNFEMSTGEIYSVGPTKSEEYQAIEVSYGEVERILNFKDKQSDYKVVFNTVDKKFELTHQSEVQSVYQGFIKLESGVDDPDVELVYSAKHSKIDVLTNDSVKDVLDKTNISSEVYFSITEKDNPHVLLRLLKCDLRKQNTFIFDTDRNISVYTKRQFAKYNYRKIG